MSKSFLIEKDGKYILIDTGAKRDKNIVEKFLKENIDDFSRLRLIIITHSHYDHTGNLYSIKNLTNVPVLADKREVKNIEEGIFDIPEGFTNSGKFMMKFGRDSKKEFEGVKVDICMENGFSLQDYGFKGKIINTPGHTEGSISVIVEKVAFVGDLCFNIPFLNSFSVLPPIGKDMNSIRSGFLKLLSYNDIEKIYPAHGESFKRKKLVNTCKKFEKNSWRKFFEKNTRKNNKAV
jgi:glyoxylase-like metal-dependent hydrolase (beta-lactamase superfamily II)